MLQSKQSNQSKMSTNWKHKNAHSKISIRDRVVDAIDRASKWVKEKDPKTGARNAFPYSIAFSADEPYCIIKVHRLTEVNTGTDNHPRYQKYAFYSIDGGSVQRMSEDRWYELYKTLYSIEDTETENETNDQYDDEPGSYEQE